MVLIILFVILFIALGVYLFSQSFSKEDYSFLTVDEETGDLAIVGGGGDLTVESGTLNSAGNFSVDGDLTTTGDITATGKKITSGSLTTGSITATGDINATGKKITSSSVTASKLCFPGTTKCLQLVTPNAWNLWLQSAENGAYKFKKPNINESMDRAARVVYNGVLYRVVAIVEYPEFREGDNVSCVSLSGFSGSKRICSLNTTLSKIDGDGAFTMDRNNEVDGSGFFQFQITPQNNYKGKVIIVS